MTEIERNPPDPPTCVTCRFFYRDEYTICEHPDCSTYDPVNGRSPIRASVARQSGKPCGYEGKLWQPRESKINWSCIWSVLAIGFVFGVLILTQWSKK